MTDFWRNALFMTGLVLSDLIVGICALESGANTIWSVLYLLLALTLYELYVWCWSMSPISIHQRIVLSSVDVRAERSATAHRVRVFAQQPVQVAFRVHHRWGGLVPLLRVTHRLTAAAVGETIIERTVTFACTWRRDLVGECQYDGLTRGVYECREIAIEVSDGLGLIRRRIQFPERLTVTVLPNPMDLTNWQPQLTGGRLQTGAGRRVVAATALTLDGEFTRLRPYEAGDSVSRIHWRASAHAGTWLTKHEEADCPSGVWIWVDDDGLAGEAAAVERRVSLAASLLIRLQYQRIPVRLSVASDQSVSFVPPSPQAPVYDGYLSGLDRLAAIPHGGTPLLSHSPTHALDVFLSTCRPQQYRHLVVLCRPGVVAIPTAEFTWCRRGGSIEWVPEVGA